MSPCGEPLRCVRAPLASAPLLGCSWLKGPPDPEKDAAVATQCEMDSVGTLLDALTSAFFLLMLLLYLLFAILARRKLQASPAWAFSSQLHAECRTADLWACSSRCFLLAAAPCVGGSQRAPFPSNVPTLFILCSKWVWSPLPPPVWAHSDCVQCTAGCTCWVLPTVLQELPYKRYRASNVELRLQFRTKFAAIIFAVFCIALLWWVQTLLHRAAVVGGGTALLAFARLCLLATSSVPSSASRCIHLAGGREGGTGNVDFLQNPHG